MEDLYAVLDIEPSSSQQQIKDRYQKLVLKHHPDKTKSNDASAFVKLTNAYKILGDGALRKEYDEKWESRCSRQHLPIDREVDFSDFQFDDEEECYLYQCRCGGDFILSEMDAQLRFDIVCCDICSLTIRVLYASEENSAYDERQSDLNSFTLNCQMENSS